MPLKNALIFCLALFLSGCGLKPIVGPSDVIDETSEFAYILVGIELEEEFGFTSDWEMSWVRVGEDVVYSDITNWEAHDWLRTTSVGPISGDEFDDVTYFLRKMKPGDFELQEMYHKSGIDYAFTKPQSSSLPFSVPRAQVSYIGTFRLARNSDECLVPVEYRMESGHARAYLEQFTAISVPIADVPLKESIQDAELGCERLDGQFFFIFIPG